MTRLKAADVSDFIAREIVGHESAAVSRQLSHLSLRRRWNRHRGFSTSPILISRGIFYQPGRTRSKNPAGFNPAFRFTQYTENQNRTHMKQTWNFKQRRRRSFYVPTAADAHCVYPIQHPGSDDHYLSFVEALEPTLRRRRCMRFLPSFALAQLIQHLLQLPTRDR